MFGNIVKGQQIFISLEKWQRGEGKRGKERRGAEVSFLLGEGYTHY